MGEKTLVEYLHEIRKCQDTDKLAKEFQIYDNYPILFYGNGPDLFDKLTQAFRNSYQDNTFNMLSRALVISADDALREPWIQAMNEPYFDYAAGTVKAQLGLVHGMWTREEDAIDGRRHSAHVMFHPYQKIKMKNTDKSIAMALAIAGFGEYIVRENLTARFPRDGLNINYNPNIKV